MSYILNVYFCFQDIGYQINVAFEKTKHNQWLFLQRLCLISTVYYFRIYYFCCYFNYVRDCSNCICLCFFIGTFYIFCILRIFFLRQSLIVLVAMPVLRDNSILLICSSSSLSKILSYMFIVQYPFYIFVFSDIVSCNYLTIKKKNYFSLVA